MKSNFYFVTEENKIIGTVEQDDLVIIYDELVKLADAQPRNSGFVGVINGVDKLIGSMFYRYYNVSDSKRLFAFIRKHRALDVLNDLCELRMKKHA